MNSREFEELLSRYLNGECTEKERRGIERFIQENLKNEPGVDSFNRKEQLRSKAKIQQAVWQELTSGSPADRKFPVTLIRWAASFLLIATVGFLTYYLPAFREKPTGTNYITKEVPRGQKTTIQLPDGSLVKLNALSSLKFPENFNERLREVYLTGEAFFEVKRNTERPFVVKSGSLQTTVLGTSFNVRAYPDEAQIAVTVATGKVGVQNADTTLSQILLPADQAVYDMASSTLHKRKADLEKCLAWRDGVIRLEDITMKQAADILEKWFDVNIIFTSTKTAQCNVNGIYENESLENILESLSFINGLQYEFTNAKTIEITGGRCE